jgi:predicted MFS family arabinose efflux permease
MAMLLLSGFHLQMRTVFYIAVIPGFIGVLLLMTLLKEEPRAPKKPSTGITAAVPLPKKFWAALAAISLFSLANSSDAFLLLQASAAGVSTAMLPLLWAAHHVIKALFSTRAGALSDRIDRRTLLVIGWMAYAAIYFTFPIAHSMRSFFILFIVYAIPFTLTEGAERAWISTMVPADARGKSFGLYYLATGIFVLAGTLLFGALYERVSHAAAFSTGACIAVIAALFVMFTPAARVSRPVALTDGGRI